MVVVGHVGHDGFRQIGAPGLLGVRDAVRVVAAVDEDVAQSGLEQEHLDGDQQAGSEVASGHDGAGFDVQGAAVEDVHRFDDGFHDDLLSRLVMVGEGMRRYWRNLGTRALRNSIPTSSSPVTT